MPTSGLCFAVTVPLGAQYGTDSGSAEGTGDHTKWGVIYDQANATMYWRTEFNMNLQVGRRLVVITHSTHGTWYVTKVPPVGGDAAGTFGLPQSAPVSGRRLR